VVDDLRTNSEAKNIILQLPTFLLVKYSGEVKLSKPSFKNLKKVA